MKIISLLIAQIFLFTTLALPESGANYGHLRPKVGISAERMQEMMAGLVELLVLDDEEMQRDVLTQALSASNVKKINAAGSIEEGLELLRNNSSFNFLVVDFRLGNYYKGNAEDNGVEFCRRAINELGFKGRIVILSADDNAVIRELAKPQYQDLNDRYQNGEILLRNKSDFGAIKNIQQIVEGKSGAVKPAKETSDEEILNLITVNLDPRDIGIEPDIVKQFSDCHVIIADDKPFMRNAFEKTFKQFFANTHKASNVDEVIRIISELRGKGVPDTEIIVLSDYEFGTEQTGKRAKDGHDLLMALRLHSDADYKGEKLDFKGGFIFVSGSIVSKHEIQGYDPMHKDISQEIKDMYGIDYIEKSTDREFQKNLVKMVYSRLQAPYNLAKPITKPLARRPLSQPADIIFLNGGINDFEGRLAMAINNLIKALDGISVNPEIRESLGALLESMLRFVDFGTVDRNMRFNARAHNYKGKLGLIGSYFIPSIQEYVQKLDADSQSKFDGFLKELDNLSLTLGIASNYTKRLLDLSSVVGNIGRPISFEDLKKISLGAFSQEYSNRINLKIDTDEGQFKETEFPYAITFIMSYILENAVEQYALKSGKEFKGNIFVAIGKDKGSGEPVIDINIQDEAGGIAEHLLPDGLFRRQVTDKKEHGGTGYGLFWAKELIEMFGGSISAGNKDKGAFFNVRLPVDWKSKFDVNGRVKKLETKIVEILTKRQVKDAENIAAKITQEIDIYSAQLSDITKRREVHLTNCFFTMRGSDREIEKMMPDFLSALDKSVNTRFADYRDIRIIAERGVAKEDIENLFLSLLDISELKRDEEPSFSLLSERQIVRIQDDNMPALLLRSKENIARENEPIIEKEQEEYQRAIRLIGYAIHKMSGNRSTISMMSDSYLKKIPKQIKDLIMDKFRKELPQDMYRTIHGLTSSDFELTGFEDSRVIIERTEGWKSAIREMVEALDNLDQGIKKAARDANVAPEEEWQDFVTKTIDESHDLVAMLYNRPVGGKRWINEYLLSYLAEGSGSRVRSFYGKYFHMSVAPGTRLWLKEFFLENTMLNICRARDIGDKKDINVNVKEEPGFTVFRITYKGQIDIDTMFMPKQDKNAAWREGPLILDLVKAMDGQINAKNIGEDVEITIKFPLPEPQIKNLEQEVADILTKRQILDSENLSVKIAKEIEDYSSMLTGIAEHREVNVSRREFKTGKYEKGSEIKRDMPNYLASLNIELGQHKLIIEQGVTKEDIQNCFLFLLTLGSVEEIEALKAPFLADRQLVRILDEGSSALLLRTKGNVSRENEPITPEEREDYQKTLRFLGYSIHKLAGGGLGLVRAFLREYKELSEKVRDEIMQEFNQHDPVDMLGSVHYLTDSEEQLTGFENDRVIIERVSGWKGVIRQLVENASRVPQEAKRRLDLIDPEAFKHERRFTRHMNEFIEDGHGLAAILNKEPIRNKRWINEYLASYPGEGSKLKGAEHFNLNAAPDTRLWLKEFFLDNIMLNVFRLTVGGKNYDEDLHIDVSEEQGSTVFNARYKGDVDIDAAFKMKVDKKEPWYNGPLLLWLIKAMDGKIEITKDSEHVNIRVSFPLPLEAMESPATNNTRISI